MKLKPHIAVVGITNADPIRDAALRYAGALERFDDHIVDCRMTVGLWTKHQDAGHLFRVLVEVDLPHTAVHLAHETANEPTEQDIDALIRGAIEAIGRQIEAALAQQDGTASKLSPEQKRLRPLHGRVE